MPLYDEIRAYCPWNEQEERDREVMLWYLESAPDSLLRENRIAHFTASAWVLDGAHEKVLMVYHNIYNSWSWTGGHADGEEDLATVAIREAREETGVKSLKLLDGGIFSLETIVVDGHEKRGDYVSSHLHLNVTYLLEADGDDALSVKPDENSGVRWFTPEDAVAASTEPWMCERVYAKLIRKFECRREACLQKKKEC